MYTDCAAVDDAANVRRGAELDQLFGGVDMDFAILRLRHSGVPEHSCQVVDGVGSVDRLAQNSGIANIAYNGVDPSLVQQGRFVPASYQSPHPIAGRGQVQGEGQPRETGCASNEYAF